MNTIVYPHGQGGRWLSHVFYSLTAGKFNLQLPKLNYHNDVEYPQCKSISVMHIEAVDHTHCVIGSFVSKRSQFIAYCNGYGKLWKNVRSTLSIQEQFFLLSNDAVWRQSEKFATQYLDHICLDANQLFLQPYAFIDSTYAVLEKSKINFCQNTDDFLIGIKNFTKTCFDLQVINNVQNLAWLAWCHAIHLVLNLPCPMDITTEFDQYVEMIHSNQDFYTNFTVNNFILSQARNTI